jgi:hypothetical protein
MSDINLNVMPNKMIKNLQDVFGGRIKVVYLTPSGPTLDANNPDIRGTFYATHDLPDDWVSKLHLAIAKSGEGLNKERKSMGNIIKRRYVLFGKGVSYTFSGTRHTGVDDKDMQALIGDVAEVTSTELNSVLVNQYTGKAAISEHSDDEEGVVPTNVPGLSLAPRNPAKKCEYKFVLRTVRDANNNKSKKKRVVYTHVFPPLCLFGMYGQDFQKSFTHEVPTGPADRGERISFTFRCLTAAPKSKKRRAEPKKRKAEPDAECVAVVTDDKPNDAKSMKRNTKEGQESACK